MVEETALCLSIQMKVLGYPGPQKVPGVLRATVLVKWTCFIEGIVVIIWVQSVNDHTAGGFCTEVIYCCVFWLGHEDATQFYRHPVDEGFSDSSCALLCPILSNQRVSHLQQLVQRYQDRLLMRDVGGLLGSPARFLQKF